MLSALFKILTTAFILSACFVFSSIGFMTLLFAAGFWLVFNNPMYFILLPVVFLFYAISTYILYCIGRKNANNAIDNDGNDGAEE